MYQFSLFASILFRAGPLNPLIWPARSDSDPCQERLVRCLLIILSLGLPAIAAGQSSGHPAEPPFTATGGFFALSVADLAASTRWYSEKLGLRVVMEVPRQNGSAVTVLEGGGLTVELVQLDQAQPMNRGAPSVQGEMYLHGVFKAGLIVENFERTVEQLRARGITIAFGPFPARENQRANLIIRDGEGNLIQFIAR